MEAYWSGSALFVIKYVNFYQKNLDQVVWLAEIRSGRGILIYSAREGLRGIDIVSGEKTLSKYPSTCTFSKMIYMYSKWKEFAPLEFLLH